jgi:predicted nucleic acid-binding protein
LRTSKHKGVLSLSYVLTKLATAIFRPEDCYCGTLFPERFQQILDRADLKFAALSDATGCPLITMDKGILSVRDTLAVPILMPFEFLLK